MEQHKITELSGSVESITFRRADTGFTVLELESDEELVTVVGVLPDVQPGEELKLTGYWDMHRSFGQQFRAELCERRMPANETAVLKYLSSGAVKGIGPATAAKIVGTFGSDTLEILDKDCMRLAEIRGITRAKAKKIGEEYKKQFAIREVMLYLSGLGMTPAECLRTYKAFGAASADMISKNPYLLCSEDIGISFERADSIANCLPKQPLPNCRIKAGILYVLRHNLGNGHTCLPRDKIIAPSCDMLECDGEAAESAVDELTEEKQIVSETINEREFLFLPYIHSAESSIAAHIKIMLQFPPQECETLDDDITKMEEELSITYAEKQREAIVKAVQKGLLILTGGPGTGKTTTLNGIIWLMEKQGLKISLTAPTGRAAKRMSEVTGKEAKTIHRLLEVERIENNVSVFNHNERNPLDTDVVIVDELSMVDIVLFESLLDALPLGCRLIMVGDSDQLPPVGAGNVLHDLIDSGLLPIVRLNEVFRQAMESLIVSNAHRIVKGDMPVLNIRNNDFFFMPENSVFETSKLVVDLCAVRLPNSYGYSPTGDIQVICPSRKGEAGTVNLNRMLQQKLNPPQKGKNEIKYNAYVLREGDKVMQIKNNYDITWTRDSGETGSGVFNGDVGALTGIDGPKRILTVRFEDREASYSFDEAGELELAYAVTVHKSQGSEFEAVIMPVIGVPPQLCYRNLLYTAVTRAKTMIIIAGSGKCLENMVKNDRKARRYSALKYFLTKED